MNDDLGGFMSPMPYNAVRTPRWTGRAEHVYEEGLNGPQGGGTGFWRPMSPYHQQRWADLPVPEERLGTGRMGHMAMQLSRMGLRAAPQMPDYGAMQRQQQEAMMLQQQQQEAWMRAMMQQRLQGRLGGQGPMMPPQQMMPPEYLGD